MYGFCTGFQHGQGLGGPIIVEIFGQGFTGGKLEHPVQIDGAYPHIISDLGNGQRLGIMGFQIMDGLSDIGV